MSWEYLRADAPRGYVPMRIVAEFVEPMVYLSDGLHIDGPIARAAYLDLDERLRRRLPPPSADIAADVRLPLARWVCPMPEDAPAHLRYRRPGRRGQDDPNLIWGWCASAEDVLLPTTGPVATRKRPAVEEMARYTSARSVGTRAGTLKSYDLAFPSVMLPAITWWALGDPEKVAALLSRHVPALGKKRGHGWGRVRRWRVEPTDADRSVVHEGRLMRRMPPTSGCKGVLRMGAIRPPYYHPSRLILAIEPEVLC